MGVMMHCVQLCARRLRAVIKGARRAAPHMCRGSCWVCIVWAEPQEGSCRNFVLNSVQGNLLLNSK